MSTRSRRVVLLLALLVIVPAIGVAVLWLVRRHARASDVRARNEAESRGPVVLVAPVETAPYEREIVLPADVRALYQTQIFAKVTGYVRSIRVDKGDRVKKDQLLVTLESPEADQALAQARSEIELRKEEEKRARSLAPAVVSQQALETAQSNLRVAEANLKRALEVKAYEELRAPFDGVITARHVDPGALVPVGTQPVVDIAEPTTLRIQVFVGEDAAPYVRAGDEVQIWEDVRPERAIDARITRTAGALDPRTRTMLVESELDNRTYGLLPGTFAHERLRVRAPALPIVPAEAVFVRGGKTMVATIADNRAHLVEIKTGISDGRVVQVLGGLRGGETVALNLPTEVIDNGPVQAKTRPPPAASAAPSGRPPDTRARRPLDGEAR